MEITRELLVDVGLTWPESRGAALRALLFNHVRIGASTLRWTPRADDELDDEHKLRLDTCWSVAVGLSMLDSVRGSAFALRALLMSLSAGEPRRIALTLSGAVFASASLNQIRRLRRLTKAIARAAAQTDAPEAACYLAVANAARAYFVDNDWAATRDAAGRSICSSNSSAGPRGLRAITELQPIMRSTCDAARAVAATASSRLASASSSRTGSCSMIAPRTAFATSTTRSRAGRFLTDSRGPRTSSTGGGVHA